LRKQPRMLPEGDNIVNPALFAPHDGRGPQFFGGSPQRGIAWHGPCVGLISVRTALLRRQSRKRFGDRAMTLAASDEGLGKHRCRVAPHDPAAQWTCPGVEGENLL